MKRGRWEWKTSGVASGAAPGGSPAEFGKCRTAGPRCELVLRSSAGWSPAVAARWQRHHQAGSLRCDLRKGRGEQRRRRKRKEEEKREGQEEKEREKKGRKRRERKRGEEKQPQCILLLSSHASHQQSDIKRKITNRTHTAMQDTRQLQTQPYSCPCPLNWRSGIQTAT